MSRPVEFQGHNAVLGPPRDMDETSCKALPVYRNGVHVVSCWQMDKDEIAEIVRTGRVFLSVRSGASQPPVYVGTEESVRGLIADNGVWRR